MAGSTTIEWTDATWNPVTGCTKISAGCDNCYAERFAERFRGTPGHPFETGFDLTLRPERLEQPLKWRRPQMIFVNSMSDLFHKEIPQEFIAKVFDTMEQATWHTFQVLTKRSSLMGKFLRRRYGETRGPAHMWFGVSVEDGTKLSRVEHLRTAPAGVRFLSIEPLIGPIGKLDLTGIDWVIVGGESGPKARPMAADWAREVRDQCSAARVPFFFKQWGNWAPRRSSQMKSKEELRRMTKKAAGRHLDGRIWDERPVSQQVSFRSAE
ncbi:MAG TPA: phage Gp37/Gp68 family protein [Candidatus Cybelea sp.]|nr:phage Gp37/Gp68 family protein [Candidatus Cybelea sp.]